MDESPNEPSPNSPEGVFQLQCNQTFVGMVTMQYQARTDMVLIYKALLFSFIATPFKMHSSTLGSIN